MGLEVERRGAIGLACSLDVDDFLAWRDGVGGIGKAYAAEIGLFGVIGLSHKEGIIQERRKDWSRKSGGGEEIEDIHFDSCSPPRISKSVATE